jgi:hypothetical protein
MRTRTQGLLVGGLVGLFVAGALALPSALPAAAANEEPAKTLLKTADELMPEKLVASMFVKPEWTVEPWVSEEVQSETTIKKIGYGRTTYVSIVTTPTGTYSSDGLASPHIKYPGIVSNSKVGSFEIVVPLEDAKLVLETDSFCVVKALSIHC